MSVRIGWETVRRDSDYFFRERDDLRRGTFAPFSRASLRPMAIACFRLFTLRPEPLLRVPFFLRCIADLTRLLAALPYLAMSSIDANAVLRPLVGREMLSTNARCASHPLDGSTYRTRERRSFSSTLSTISISKTQVTS